jgi:hypothetical protein
LKAFREVSVGNQKYASPRILSYCLKMYIPRTVSFSKSKTNIEVDITPSQGYIFAAFNLSILSRD